VNACEVRLARLEGVITGPRAVEPVAVEGHADVIEKDSL
jgi:hypothetical protein